MSVSQRLGSSFPGPSSFAKEAFPNTEKTCRQRMLLLRHNMSFQKQDTYLTTWVPLALFWRFSLWKRNCRKHKRARLSKSAQLQSYGAMQGGTHCAEPSYRGLSSAAGPLHPAGCPCQPHRSESWTAASCTAPCGPTWQKSAG